MDRAGLIAGLYPHPYGRLFRRVVNKRRDFEHQLSKRLVDQYGMIATEKLNVAGMTASAKGTVEDPGKNVKQKAGLNRKARDRYRQPPARRAI